MRLVSQKEKIKRLGDINPTILVMVVFLLQARLDPDAHHDGIVLTAALANSSGLKPNLDFFSQYGPIPPAFQGIFLHLFGERLIVLRVLTALMLSVIAFLALKSIQIETGKKIAYLAVIYWALSAPTYLIPTNTPWASVFTSLISLLILNFSRKPKIRWFTIMMLVALGTLCRVQFILIAVILILGVSLRNRVVQNKIFGIYWTTGVTMLIVSLAMQISGILVPYVRENIIWSYITYSPNPISFNKASAIKLAGLIWIPICAFLFARMTKSFASTNYSRKHRFRLLIIVLPITAISIVVFFNLINFGHDSFSNPFYILKYLMRVLVFSGIFSLVGLFFVAVTKKIRNTKLGNLSDAQLIQLSVALTAVIQLYPQWDEMHIWWLSPIFAVIVFNFLTFKEAHVAGFLVLLIFVASFQFLGNLSAERTKFSDELLTGMIGTKASVRDLGTTLVTLENHFTTREYKFDCDNAIYAGAGGKYLSEFHSYVNWGPVVRADNVQKPRGVFYCNLSYSQAIEKQMHSEYNYIKLIKSGSNSWNVLMMNQD